MAGMMYLGSQKVTPVIIQGGGYKEFPFYTVTDGTANYVQQFKGDEFNGITTIGDYCFSQICNGKQNISGFLNFGSVKNIGNYGLYYAFYETTTYGESNSITLDLSSVETIGEYGLQFAFFDSDLTGTLDLGSLTSIRDYGLANAFTNTKITSVNLSSLVSIQRYGLSSTFIGCGYLQSLNLSSLEYVNTRGMSGAFQRCTGITDIYLSSLNFIGSRGLNDMCYGCSGLKNIYFNSLTSQSFGTYKNQFYGMLSSVNGCTVHFPSNLESVIGSWSDVLSGFDGTNTTVLFDLEATS